MTAPPPARAGSTVVSRSTPKDFIKTGPDLSQEDLAAAEWPLSRAPLLLETSLPGVFAVGDVRGGDLKRVASAVGEGAIAVAFVHQVLHE
jgi:thioredoxin reductase (NADPH)